MNRFLLVFAFSTINAMAWDKDVYESVREGVVMRATRVTNRTVVTKDGVTRHFAFEKEVNEYAELLANHIANDTNPAARAERLWSTYHAVMTHPQGGDMSIAFLLARRASVTPELTDAFLANVKGIRYDLKNYKPITQNTFKGV
jgi:hypothetical protein